jgi:hypothetical protein
LNERRRRRRSYSQLKEPLPVVHTPPLTIVLALALILHKLHTNNERNQSVNMCYIIFRRRRRRRRGRRRRFISILNIRMSRTPIEGSPVPQDVD